MIVKQSHVKKEFKIDKTLLALVLIMFTINIIAVYCAIPLTSSGSMKVLYRQIIWIGLSLGVLLFLLFFGIDRLFSGVSIFYWIDLFLLFLLVIDKYIDLPLIKPVLGTRAWIYFGNLFSFQPSEFMKIILIIKVANIISDHNNNKTDNSYLTDIKLLLKILIYALPPVILILLEPDTGLPIIMFVSLSIMILCSGINKLWIYIYFTVIIGIIAGIIGLFYLNPSLLTKLLGNAYKLNRFYGWLETDKYISSYGSQLYQAKLAVGSAGLFGHGIQSEIVYFAEPQNDFIFAVIAQNFGFIGASFVIIICLLFDFKLIIISRLYPLPREKYLVIGMVGMLIFQQIENIGMILGLFPITGITLPLISSGGSSLISYMIPLAIVFQMSSENKCNINL